MVAGLSQGWADGHPLEGNRMELMDTINGGFELFGSIYLCQIVWYTKKPSSKCDEM